MDTLRIIFRHTISDIVTMLVAFVVLVIDAYAAVAMCHDAFDVSKMMNDRLDHPEEPYSFETFNMFKQ